MSRAGHYLLFPERSGKIPKRQFNAFDRETEKELAQAFGRIPRLIPDPEEVPFYPYLPPKVSFKLNFNFSEIFQ